MLVMVLDGTFHEAYERGLLDIVPQRISSNMNYKMFFVYTFSFPQLQTNTCTSGIGKGTTH